MKRIIYLALFTLLGVLLATLIHALIEIPVLTFLARNIEQYENSFMWQHWNVIHDAVSFGLWVLGAIGGYLGGKKWWQILYVEKRYGTPRF